MLSEEQLQQYHHDGYLTVSGLFSHDEAEFFKEHYEAMRQREVLQNQSANDTVRDPKDPLLTYPRLMQPHRRDQVSLKWLIDERLNACMTELLGSEPYAVQTMFYFKPPGARGQALHQDQYYLRVQPGTCMAAWLAVDDCDEENGCLRAVPGSHTWPVLCITEADTDLSFTDVTVPLPEDTEIAPIEMKAGDVFFFNGQIVHGSLPNRSNRFRRALIGHYIVGEAEKVYQWYHPALRMNGSEIQLGQSDVGGPCGIWTSREGESILEMQLATG
ncbi:phytanoyl-CoA dioxygenase family protein [Chloroflexi bacterium TSY]|nr:phytanoyl-CoA dioxygenase family protein [Chloroflexi bacterium TSY]